MIDHSKHQEHKDNKKTLGAVVLAGGLARRMEGQDKGLVLLAGQPMIHYALITVLPVVQRCVVNANRNHDTYERISASTVSVLFRPNRVFKRVEIIKDSWPGHLGPLAGLSAAMNELDNDYIFMCPCDSPFLQAELIELLYSRCIDTDADIAVAHDGERLQPVFSVVNRRVQSSLDEFLGEGERKIDRWFEKHNVCEVAAEQFSDSFVNINTEEERREAEKVFSR
ncbi:MAG: molybdenum cofactor guanylyltransferase [Granulosicoccus sp.]|nr:molybdenum cofactor guanylyltransferase [Granulosicoccus sp.]